MVCYYGPDLRVDIPANIVPVWRDSVMFRHVFLFGDAIKSTLANRLKPKRESKRTQGREPHCLLKGRSGGTPYISELERLIDGTVEGVRFT